jgi:hypothetical protein
LVYKQELTCESELVSCLLDNLCLLEFVNAHHLLPRLLFVLSVLLSRQMDDPATNTQITMTTDATYITAHSFVSSKPR